MIDTTEAQPEDARGELRVPLPQDAVHLLAAEGIGGVGLLPTPALRPAAFLGLLRAEVTLRQQQRRTSDRP